MWPRQEAVFVCVLHHGHHKRVSVSLFHQKSTNKPPCTQTCFTSIHVMPSKTHPLPSTRIIVHNARRAIHVRKHATIAIVISAVLLLLCVGTAALVVFYMIPKRRRAPPRAPPLAQGMPAESPDACNPLCSPIFQSCRLVPTPPGDNSDDVWSGTKCVNNCGFTSLPMNKMCIGSTTIDVCLTNVPTGTGTAVILQSQVSGPNGITYALTAKKPASAGSPPTLVLEEAQLDNFNQYFTFLSTSVDMCKPTSTKCSKSVMDVCPCNCDVWPTYHVGDYGSNKTPIQCPVPGASPPVSSSVNAFAACSAVTDKIMAPCKNSYKVLVTAAQNPVGMGWAVQAAPTVTATSTAPVRLVAQEAATWREIPGAQAHMFAPFRDNNPKTGSMPSTGVWLTDVSFDRCEENRTAVLTAVGASAGSPVPPTLRWVGNNFPSGLNTDVASLKPNDGWNVIPVNMTQEFFIRHSCEAGVRIPPPSFTSSKVAKDISHESRVWGEWNACSGTKKTTSPS